MNALQIIDLGIIALTVVIAYLVFKTAWEIRSERAPYAVLLVVAMLMFIAFVVSLL